MTSEYHRLRTIANETGYSPEKVAILEAVSYTHLTLPTIYSV